MLFLLRSQQHVFDHSHSMMVSCVCGLSYIVALFIVTSVLLGDAVPTPSLSLCESDHSIDCFLSHWHCSLARGARLCYPMSDVALVNLCWTIVAK